MEKFTTRLTIAIMALMVMLSISNQAKAGWYDTASKDHKKWAKEFYQVKDKDKYTNVHEIGPVS